MIQKTLNEMAISIEEILQANKSVDHEISILTLNLIGNILSESAKLIKINRLDYEIPYGRYLVYESENFNIQIDVFSKSYSGRIHNHGTWGCLAIINGSLIVEDYIEEMGKGLLKIRTSLLTAHSFSSFPYYSDWHSTQTTGLSGQEVSFHIYGKEFNLEKGFYYDENLKEIHSYKRGKLNDIRSIINFFEAVS